MLIIFLVFLLVVSCEEGFLGKQSQKGHFRRHHRKTKHCLIYGRTQGPPL